MIKWVVRYARKMTLLVFGMASLSWASVILAAEENPEASEGTLWLKVTAPYVDVHTGPGRGYPVNQIVEKGDLFYVVRQRTDWLQIRFLRGESLSDDTLALAEMGWISADSLDRVTASTGEAVVWTRRGADSFYERQWELGVGTGSLRGGSILSVNAAWSFSRHLSLEADLGQSLGRYAENDWLAWRLVHHPYPDWRYTPFLGVGFGTFHTVPKTTLAVTEDRSDDFWQVAVGLKAHLWRGILLRVDYQHNAIFTSRENNEFVGVWRAGIGYFF